MHADRIGQVAACSSGRESLALQGARLSNLRKTQYPKCCAVPAMLSLLHVAVGLCNVASLQRYSMR